MAGPVAGCGAGSAVYDYGEVVEGGVGRSTEVEVAPGQRFSLAVEDNASVGDSWKLGPLPDPKVASFISAEYESEGGEDTTGGGGVRYFVFNAKQRGTTAVTLSNCWRCTAGRVPSDEQSRRLSGDAVFRITVK
nr:protease inhibitor I42 family protein [Planomonospora venezuelensis]